jgi:hypothetical protein
MTLKLADMTDQEIIDLVKGAHDAIFVSECYGTRDMRAFEYGSAELSNRGYDVNRMTILSIELEGEVQ